MITGRNTLTRFVRGVNSNVTHFCNRSSNGGIGARQQVKFKLSVSGVSSKLALTPALSPKERENRFQIDCN